MLEDGHLGSRHQSIRQLASQRSTDVAVRPLSRSEFVGRLWGHLAKPRRLGSHRDSTGEDSTIDVYGEIGLTTIQESSAVHFRSPLREGLLFLSAPDNYRGSMPCCSTGCLALDAGANQ